MIHIIKEEPNKLIKCQLVYQGNNTWQITPTTYKNGSLASKKGIVVRGEEDKLRRFLIGLKIKDSESKPASLRKLSYKDMVEMSKAGKGIYIWVYNKDWKKYANTNGIIEV